MKQTANNPVFFAFPARGPLSAEGAPWYAYAFVVGTPEVAIASSEFPSAGPSGQTS